MKKIEVSDSDYEFLMNLKNELNTQDNRATQSPFFYQVRSEYEKYVPEGCGEEAWFNGNDWPIYTDSDIKESIFEINDWDLDSISDNKKFEELSLEERYDLLSSHYQKIYIGTEEKYSNSFLTEKACNEYIRCDKHNLGSNPVSYVSYAPKNPELEQLINILKNLE